jgi:hypothetical protein
LGFAVRRHSPNARFAFRFAALLLPVLGAGCGGSSPTGAAPDPNSDPGLPRTRYSFNNHCFALKSAANDRYVAASSATTYSADAPDITAAEAFFLKPAALGEYLLYDRAGNLVAAGASASNPGGAACQPGQTLCNQPLASATDAARFVVKGAGDTTAYPAAAQFNVEPPAAQVSAWRSFADPQFKSTIFTLAARADGQRVTAGSSGLALAAPDESPAQQFVFEALAPASCAAFPEAGSNASGETFKGRTADDRVLGMADVHVHIGSTTFLGGAFAGTPFHPLGVTHALPDCASAHGEGGSRDVIGAFLGGGQPGHATAGWPDFTDWPAAHNLTHQAIYWKWLERAWLAGLRVVVNDLVENGTLCELQRSNSNSPDTDCNEMNEAGRQAGTMYAMQDYVDAQYGGPGAGWLRIVYGADEARGAIEAGKLAMVLGIEVSNFLDCQPTYNPLRQKEPYQEPTDAANSGAPADATENTYTCRMTETGAPDEILTQMQRIHGWGVRQVISIHEFDNAFGGNGIFFPIINIGNRENSGGIPASDPSGPFSTDPDTPTGEFWTTYNCPEENVTPGFSGYLWEDIGGAAGADLRDAGTGSPLPANCAPTGQNGRPGGTTACYPDAQQCNARWMTPIGLYMYSKLMQFGFIFDFDHMELAMKTQALELAEAQPIAYPFVSTHGTYGGTGNDQARRVLRNGGFLYPAIDSAAQMAANMSETLSVYEDAFAGVPASGRPIFGFGFGTDTNGLSAQASVEPDVTYPYTLFTGPVFGELPDFIATGARVEFARPQAGNRSWDITQDGSAEYGMLSDLVESLRLHGTQEQMTSLYNSAERYLQTWERTEDASAAIEANGGIVVPAGVLRPAPLAGQTSDIP